MRLTKKERVLRTFNYKEVDRPAVYDIIHSYKFIEYVYGKTITSRNAEDAICYTIAKTLDMTRHFAIPSLEKYIKKDEDGFVYEIKWNTADIKERPYKTVSEAKEFVKKDIYRIREAIENKKFCPQAKYNVNLFDDRYDDPEVLNSEFERIQNKLDGTIMIAPEFVDGFGPVVTKYNYDTFVYLYYDYPDLISELLQAHLDYCLNVRIDSFPGPKLTPIAFTGTMASGPSGLYFSPDFLDKEIFPCVQKIVDRLKKKGYRVIYDFEGDAREVFEKIANSGADAYTPVEEISGMSVEWVKEKYPKLILGFMIDSINLLTRGNKNDVIKKTKGIIELAKKYGGIMIGSSGTINEETDIENVLAMINTTKNSKF